jgi:hypothetical protein
MTRAGNAGSVAPAPLVADGEKDGLARGAMRDAPFPRGVL